LFYEVYILKTDYIYEKANKDFGSIYVRGVKISEESNYLFDYNITRVNAALKKSLNRERSAVGRSAYSELVKKIILKSNSEIVVETLVSELEKFSSGTQSDEIQLTGNMNTLSNVFNDNINIYKSFDYSCHYLTYMDYLLKEELLWLWYLTETRTERLLYCLVQAAWERLSCAVFVQE